MKLYQCSICDHVVYFQNTRCVRCGSDLAFDPETLSMRVPKSPLCRNGIEHNACNWLASDQSNEGFCLSCHLNRTIPNLGDSNNLSLWKTIQHEKHYLVYSLLRFQLPVISKKQSDTGLAFDFLDVNSKTSEPAVRTGHAGGIITLDIREADDAYREAVRQQMREPYRTLLGHFRHESAHYYWDLLVKDTLWIDTVRAVFGDERIDYAQSLDNHYQAGSPLDWENHYISAYASAHPWEDWAETWAHYFHIVDTLESAHELGLSLDPETGRSLATPATTPLDPYQSQHIEELLAQWLPISVGLNMLNRSLGQGDAYPFVLSEGIINKLSTVHAVVSGSSQIDDSNAMTYR